MMDVALRSIGVAVSHTRMGCKLRLALGERPTQPDAWHTIASAHTSREEARLIVAILRAGCLAAGIRFVELGESRAAQGGANVLASSTRHVATAIRYATNAAQREEEEAATRFARAQAAKAAHVRRLQERDERADRNEIGRRRGGARRKSFSARST